ncbi:hypothetical protein KPH14_008598 [Odynerus spinipes]|uniref:Uncharacterized protein n=1 Tax=Odynerus spinipes TaxID=1348599 RepID=A0AAD9RSM0_9HYME|nr:hypothetical protein KPH14_008598 [Odynerus spinipes]
MYSVWMERYKYTDRKNIEILYKNNIDKISGILRKQKFIAITSRPTLPPNEVNNSTTVSSVGIKMKI